MNSRRTDRKAAMAPDTWGAAMLVPLSSLYCAVTLGGCAGAATAAPAARARGAGAAGAPHCATCCLRASIWAGGEAADQVVAHETIFSPGATRSGLARPSPVGPFDEKYETPYTCGLSRWVEPTVTARSALPASLMVSPRPAGTVPRAALCAT